MYMLYMLYKFVVIINITEKFRLIKSCYIIKYIKSTNLIYKLLNIL